MQCLSSKTKTYYGSNLTSDTYLGSGSVKALKMAKPSHDFPEIIVKRNDYERKPMSVTKTIYYDEHGPEIQYGFRNGSRAWWVRLDPDSEWGEHLGEFEISEHLYWSLFHLGMIDALEELPHDGLMGAYKESILLLSSLDRASEILREHADNLAETRYEWDCLHQFRPEKIQYKIVVEATRLKRELLALADFMDRGASLGYNVQLWL